MTSTVRSEVHMNDGVQAMLDQLNAGFPRVENMTGPQARAVVNVSYAGPIWRTYIDRSAQRGAPTPHPICMNIKIKGLRNLHFVID